jgi:hypothetical protein
MFNNACISTLAKCHHQNFGKGKVKIIDESYPIRFLDILTIQ